MNKELFKDLITLKLRTVEKIIKICPLNIPINKAYEDLIHIINESTSEYIQETKKEKDNEEIKNININ
ncbi:hypothetical protein CLPU_8c01070 [Gottschalkia purinilytica]|uniref:Uncharacterized protein n=1 Tax=Gottschalkia purinilytica TaxID=1503 RepID=A0A0L0WA86_GOTPU|nr:hypothetical protein [Gottschalkia purinilytica]KNF08342.1 hypothetical protein CLPU_8c01070 [Gottschalkia purinilytica]